LADQVNFFFLAVEGLKSTFFTKNTRCCVKKSL